MENNINSSHNSTPVARTQCTQDTGKISRREGKKTETAGKEEKKELMHRDCTSTRFRNRQHEVFSIAVRVSR